MEKNANLKNIPRIKSKKFAHIDYKEELEKVEKYKLLSKLVNINYN